MQALSNSICASKMIFRRNIAIISIAVGSLALSGCMGSVTTTMNASQQLGEVAIASYEKLNLSEDLLADALAAQRLVASAAPQSLPYHKGLSVDDTAQIAVEDQLKWKNGLTGSSGQISQIVEKSSGDRTCRNFTTTRLSFAGVQTFEGLSCQAVSGGWTLKKFEPLA